MLQIRKKILISPCPNSGLRGVTISSPTLKQALAWLIGFPGREVTFLVLCHRGLLGFLGGGRLGLSPISGLGVMLIGLGLLTQVVQLLTTKRFPSWKG